MAKKKKNEFDGEDTMEEVTSVDGESLSVETESPSVEQETPSSSDGKKVSKKARMPPLKKGVKEGEITFDIFFAWSIKKSPNVIRPDHYRAMKVFLISKSHAMIDTKEGFCQIFKQYGLNLE